MDELPTFTKWDDIPDTMATKTTLSKVHRRKLAPDQEPVGRKKAFNHRGKHVGYYDLYLIADAIEKKPPTEAQLAALEKARKMAEQVEVCCSECGQPIMRHYRRYSDVWTVTRKQYIEDKLDAYTCHICDDRKEAKAWAVNLLEYGDFVILDTETTDLHGEIIEIAVIDQDGNTLLDQRIKPQEDISEGAYRVHGISLDDLKDCPTFPDVYQSIVDAVAGKPVIIYNADYDERCIRQDCKRHDLEPIKLETACAMLWYSQWYGDWSRYHDDYKWQPLNGTHGALGDCKATLAVLQKMAGLHKVTQPR